LGWRDDQAFSLKLHAAPANHAWARKTLIHHAFRNSFHIVATECEMT
jgi:hypothetical protein